MSRSRRKRKPESLSDAEFAEEFRTLRVTVEGYEERAEWLPVRLKWRWCELLSFWKHRSAGPAGGLYVALEGLRQELRVVEGQIYNHERKLVLLAQEACGIEGLDVPGTQTCLSLENPLEHCVYNVDEDPSLDDCLFCRHPEERK